MNRERKRGGERERERERKSERREREVEHSDIRTFGEREKRTNIFSLALHRRYQKKNEEYDERKREKEKYERKGLSVIEVGVYRGWVYIAGHQTK